jgi:Flp pilus assembly pilin Flp
MDAIVPDRSERRATPLARLFFRDETAATSIEYGLIAMLVSLIIIGGLQVLGTETGALYSSTAARVAAALSIVGP